MDMHERFCGKRRKGHFRHRLLQPTANAAALSRTISEIPFLDSCFPAFLSRICGCNGLEVSARLSNLRNLRTLRSNLV